MLAKEGHENGVLENTYSCLSDIVFREGLWCCWTSRKSWKGNDGRSWGDSWKAGYYYFRGLGSTKRAQLFWQHKSPASTHLQPPLFAPLVARGCLPLHPSVHCIAYFLAHFRPHSFFQFSPATLSLASPPAERICDNAMTFPFAPSLSTALQKTAKCSLTLHKTDLWLAFAIHFLASPTSLA